jgi:hypothetical protein
MKIERQVIEVHINHSVNILLKLLVIIINYDILSEKKLILEIRRQSLCLVKLDIKEEKIEALLKRIERN